MQIEHVAGLRQSSNPDLILVNSPLRDYDKRPKDDYEVLPPLGLAYIASKSARRGHNVGLVDAEHHGIGQSTIANIVNALNPRFAGINVLTPARPQALSFAKNLDQNIPLIIGGSHATSLTEKTLREFALVHEKVILIRSEAELAVTAILDGQDVHSIPGAFWLNKGNMEFTPGLSVPNNLDELPILNRKFLDNDPSIDYRTGMHESRVLTSRGCPFDCTFCAGARSSLSLDVRNRGVESVASEIKGLLVDSGIQSVRFMDDLFMSSEKRTRSILEALRKTGVSNLYWDATGRASILAKFNSSFFDYLKENGANEFAMGIESGSERLRKRINKQVSMAEIEKSLVELTKRGIKVKGYFIIGLPTETKEETQSTIDLARNLTQKYPGFFNGSIFIFRPYPGTQEWKYLINEGYNEEELLSMRAEGIGELARSAVLTSQKFSEYSPDKLSSLLMQYDEWKKNFFI
ncbi:MAG: Radical SAM family protein [Candidatus Roizmanbacteria bacterium GW2011_GWA2_35_19]|uniref:Radical SAM family protein n=2 Tax=Candidatus Roizmaniibacteriota TaxID=1752723 RepID=A0A0G0EWP9_9BACT|nr:MAG: Radical SAM family protein [Candidatus Roizmanbacteria bacterium GW2011_GWC2_35_12]KKP71557.1 MAG: Radical SAM family protein [Candidatus Roizmanbacteria bacterium GW2011_GWA2_35_19]